MTLVVDLVRDGSIHLARLSRALEMLLKSGLRACPVLTLTTTEGDIGLLDRID